VGYNPWGGKESGLTEPLSPERACMNCRFFDLKTAEACALNIHLSLCSTDDPLILLVLSWSACSNYLGNRITNAVINLILLYLLAVHVPGIM